jgi:hypothetical protein
MEVSERRRAPRKPAKFLVKFRLSGDVADRLGQVRDVSSKGLSVETKRAPPVGVVIELKMPDSPFGPARTLHAKVCWTSEGAEPGDVRFGVTFVAAPKEKGPPPAAPAGAERRRFPRRAEKLLLKVKCVTKGVFHEIAERGAMLTDISKGGMEIMTTRDYAPGCILEIVVPESALGPGRTVHARIAWARAIPEKVNYYAIGCSFVKLSAPAPPEGI